jgi:FKBP-type peptidyl-prolyl cis-trans isomerase (trigger factor)
MQIKTNNLPNSEIEITGEIPASEFESYFPKALKYLGENVELDGFRKGKAPENVLLSKLPESKILEEMAEMALGETYPKILEEHKIDAIGRPEIVITKLARNNELGFKIKTAVIPTLKLPDYKKIAKDIQSNLTDEEKDNKVTADEMEKVILDIRKSRAPKIETKEGEEEKELEPILPELNDEFVQAMGPFENVEDFKKKLEENMKLEKENMVKEKTRIKMIEAIIEKTEVEVPHILVDVETNKIIGRMKDDIAQMGLKFEDYLKHLQKSEEDLRKDFEKDALQRAKLALVLAEIAKLENIKPEEADIEHEVAHILEHYKDADPERARMHTENVLTNDKVFKFLETQ